MKLLAWFVSFSERYSVFFLCFFLQHLQLTTIKLIPFYECTETHLHTYTFASTIDVHATCGAHLRFCFVCSHLFRSNCYSWWVWSNECSWIFLSMSRRDNQHRSSTVKSEYSNAAHQRRRLQTHFWTDLVVQVKTYIFIVTVNVNEN